MGSGVGGRGALVNNYTSRKHQQLPVHFPFYPLLQYAVYFLTLISPAYISRIKGH